MVDGTLPCVVLLKLLHDDDLKVLMLKCCTLERTRGLEAYCLACYKSVFIINQSLMLIKAR